MKLEKVSEMLDEISPDIIKGFVSFALASSMALLTVLAEGSKRSIKNQILEVLICGFLGLAAFTFCRAIEVDEYYAFTVGIMIGKIGSIRASSLAEKLINKKIK